MLSTYKTLINQWFNLVINIVLIMCKVKNFSWDLQWFFVEKGLENRLIDL